MMSQIIAVIKNACLLACFILPFPMHATSWQILETGLLYQELNYPYLTPWSHIHIFKIDLNRFDLSSLLARELNLPRASISQFAQYSQALIALNGGFFDRKNHALGLRINHSQQTNPLKKISWWGIFYIKNRRAFLVDVNHFSNKGNYEFAVQSGPRLLVNNAIPVLKKGRAERSALGITKEGQLIILVTESMPISTIELAKIMQSPPLNCKNALNLDGGSSSQLFAKINSFYLNVANFAKVSDAIVVKRIV